jgi:hypothetical protein
MSRREYYPPSKRFEKTPPLDELRNCFASTRETLELLNAFSRIENPIIRSTIIRTAREAVFAEPIPQVVKSNPDPGFSKLANSFKRRTTPIEAKGNTAGGGLKGRGLLRVPATARSLAAPGKARPVDYDSLPNAPPKPSSRQ